MTVVVVRGFPFKAALKPPTMLLFEALLGPSSTIGAPRGTKRPPSRIHRFSSGRSGHSEAVVCTKRAPPDMTLPGPGRYAGRKFCKDQQR